MYQSALLPLLPGSHKVRPILLIVTPMYYRLFTSYKILFIAF